MEERSYNYQEENKIPEPKKRNFWMEIVKFVFLTLIIVVPFRLFIAQPFIVSGASMDPTFEDGEYLIVDQLSFRFEEPKRESVVIFKYPKDTSKFFIKRIIGLPGETVLIDEGNITIKNEENPDGFELEETYVDPNNRKIESFTITLDDDEYFVMGDNRLGSFDSRSWGPVEDELIIGRPLFRLLPFNRVDLLPGDYSLNY